MKKKSGSSKPVKQSVFFLYSWLICGPLVALVATATGSKNGVVTDDTLFDALGHAIVIGGLLAAVPTAILGSIRKSKEKK